MAAQQSLHGTRRIVVAVGLGLALAGLDAVAGADVQPGDVIGPGDVAKVQDLVTPGLEWCVRRGLPMRIVRNRQE